jgi:hypothetical protein
MKKLLRPGMLAAAMCLVASGMARADDDGRECRLRTLHGRYVFAANGFDIVVVNGVEQLRPKAIVEVIDFNGDGTLSVPATTRNVNGVAARIPPSVGTYTVDAECTGTITFAGPMFDIVVKPRGDGLWMILTNAPFGVPSVLQGTASRVSRQGR